MKKFILAILTLSLLASGTNLFAQGKYGADSAECIKYLSYYSEYFKQKNYDEALPHWRKAYKLCPPQSRQTMLVDGTTLLRKLITKNFKDVEYRQALIDSLMTLHDLRIEYYPTYAVTALNNKGMDLANYVKGDNKKLYEGYNQIIENNKDKTMPQIFLFCINSAVELFKANELEAEDVINCYQNCVSYVDKIEPKSDMEASNKAKIKSDIESLFIGSKVASCESLIALFTPRYEAAPDDVDLCSKIVKMMGTAENCTDNELFLNAVTSMHKSDPSHTSAYYLFKLNSSKGNVAEAVNYLEEAIASDGSDDLQDGEYLYELATFCFKNGQNAKAFDSATKAAAKNSAFAGKAYFLMGTIWASVVCQGNEIEKRAPFWVAVDYFTKAKAADPELAEEANKYISNCHAYFPQTAEAFMYDVTDGQSYTVSCGGMKATTTVRTQK